MPKTKLSRRGLGPPQQAVQENRPRDLGCRLAWDSRSKDARRAAGRRAARNRAAPDVPLFLGGGPSRQRPSLRPAHVPKTREDPADAITIGGSGFGVMALIVAAERRWITRAAALERLDRMLELLLRARCYHGAYPHFMHGSTGEAIPFGRKDDGADLVETSFLMMGLLCAREYFARDTPAEASARARITTALDRGGVELVHARRARRALLALEPVQRLGHGSRDSRLERVPRHIRARGLVAALFRRAQRSITAASRAAPDFAIANPGMGSTYPSAWPMAARCSSPTTRSAASILGGSRTDMPTTGHRTCITYESTGPTASRIRGNSGVTANPAGG